MVTTNSDNVLETSISLKKDYSKGSEYRMKIGNIYPCQHQKFHFCIFKFHAKKCHKEFAFFFIAH